MKNNEINCPICLSEITENYYTVEKCKHVYCESCIKKWIIINKICPLDRTKLTKLSFYNQISKDISIISINNLVINCLLDEKQQLTKKHFKRITDYFPQIDFLFKKIKSFEISIDKIYEKFDSIKFQNLLNSTFDCNENEFKEFFFSINLIIGEFRENFLDDHEKIIKDWEEIFYKDSEAIHRLRINFGSQNYDEFEVYSDCYGHMMNIYYYFKQILLGFKRYQYSTNGDEIHKKILIKLAYEEEIINIKEWGILIYNNIKFMKSQFLHLISDIDRINLYNEKSIFENSIDKCLICNDFIKDDFKKFDQCQHKICMNCKMYTMTDINCPFDNLSSISQDIQTQQEQVGIFLFRAYRNINDETMEKILDGITFAMENINDVFNTDRIKFIQLNAPSFGQLSCIYFQSSLRNHQSRQLIKSLIQWNSTVFSDSFDDLFHELDIPFDCFAQLLMKVAYHIQYISDLLQSYLLNETSTSNLQTLRNNSILELNKLSDSFKLEVNNLSEKIKLESNQLLNSFKLEFNKLSEIQNRIESIN